MVTRATGPCEPGGYEDAPAAPQQRLYFLPLPHEQGSLRPGLASLRRGIDRNAYRA